MSDQNVMIVVSDLHKQLGTQEVLTGVNLKIPRGETCVILGRSDSTLNRSGVRMGTSEFYRLVEAFPEVADSLVVDTGQGGRDGKLILFVVLTHGLQLDHDLRARLRLRIKEQLSPRHAPDDVIQVSVIPRRVEGPGECSAGPGCQGSPRVGDGLCRVHPINRTGRR